MSLMAMPGVAMLQGVGPQVIPESGTIGNCSFITGDFSFDCIPLYLGYIINLSFAMAAGFALLEIVRGGYEYGASGAQSIVSALPDKEAAKKRITNAVIGMIVVVFAYLIVDTIVSVIFTG